MSNRADYIYRDKGDQVRFKIFKRYNDHFGTEWDYDVFVKRGDIETYSDIAGDYFRTKKEAKADIECVFGEIVSLGSIETVTEGW